jgi:hypothetical protein
MFPEFHLAEALAKVLTSFDKLRTGFDTSERTDFATATC